MTERTHLDELEFSELSGIPVDVLKKARNGARRLPGVEWIRVRRNGKECVRYLLAKWHRHTAQQKAANAA